MIVDPDQIRRHVGSLRSLQDRLDGVRATGSAIGRDDSVFGLLCSWLPAILAARHRRQEELTDFIAENLGLLAADLQAAAADYESTDANSAAVIRYAGGLT